MLQPIPQQVNEIFLHTSELSMCVCTFSLMADKQRNYESYTTIPLHYSTQFRLQDDERDCRDDHNENCVKSGDNRVKISKKFLAPLPNPSLSTILDPPLFYIHRPLIACGAVSLSFSGSSSANSCSNSYNHK